MTQATTKPRTINASEILEDAPNGGCSIQKIEQWEEAWSNYIDALEAWDCLSAITGEDFVFWCGTTGRRLDEAKRRLRQIDPKFCKGLGI